MSSPLVALVLALIPQDSSTFTEGHDRFALELLRAMTEQRGNVLLSPFSVAGALGIAREGAVGDTASQIDAVFHFPSTGAVDALSQLSKRVAPQTDETHKVPAYEFGVANSLWVQKGYEITPRFAERMERDSLAQFFDADFLRAPEDARVRINAWISERTKTRISEMLPEGAPTADTRVLLANAVYLKALWATPFESNHTRPRAFHAPTGDVRVPMMNLRREFEFVGESERAQVLALPYRGGLEMLIVLPKEIDGVSAVLAHESLANWTARLTKQEVQLALPKFEFSGSYELVSTLAKLGIHAAFSPELADFSGLSPRARDPRGPLYIGIVRHKSWIAVDELGTEAAAATTAEWKAGAAMRPDDGLVRFIVDRPFLFFIRHRPSGLTLFAGRVDDPSR